MVPKIIGETRSITKIVRTRRSATSGQFLSVQSGGSGGQLELPGLNSPPLRIISSNDEWQSKRLAGKERMLALRARAIEKGMPLMTIEEIRAESNKIKGIEDDGD